jgi:hypothetical protein
MYKKETDMPITLINAALALPKRPNKELAMEYLREIYEDHPDKVFQLAALYNYFMPASPAKAKTDFRWVARSVGDNDARSGMNYVWVEGGVMVACNGHTLHQAPSTLAPGYYHPKTGEPCNCDYVYPAPPRVVPQTPSNGYADFTLRLADTTTEEVHNKHGVLHQHLCVPTDYGIQRFERKHILAALNGRTESRAYITTNADSPGIVIMDGDRLAIVMGARK